MNLKLCSLYDSKSAVFLPVFQVRSEGEAIRVLTDAVNEQSQSTPVSKHPEDFQLFQLAEIDDLTGQVTPVTPAKCLISAAEVVKNG